ncbi:MAG: hypothetical protein ACRBBM_12215 [Pseudomonadaceae bacterium]
MNGLNLYPINLGILAIAAMALVRSLPMTSIFAASALSDDER